MSTTAPQPPKPPSRADAKAWAAQGDAGNRVRSSRERAVEQVSASRQARRPTPDVMRKPVTR